MITLRISLLFLVALLIPNLFLFSQNQAQQKYNLNFDNLDSIHQVLPNGWFTWGIRKRVKSEQLNDDNHVGKVTSDSIGKFAAITYRIPAIYNGDTITLSGKIKFENVEKFVGLIMRIDDAVGYKSLAFKSMQELNIKGTSDWKEYSIKLPYPNNAKSINVAGFLGGKGTAWFDDFKVTIDGEDIQTLKEISKIYLQNFDSIELKTAISNSSSVVDLTTEASLSTSLNPLIEILSDKKIVAIGESTHGTSEFYKMREIITKRLIQEKGFNMVILENPYDDIEILNKSLSTSSLDSLIKNHLFSIYQTEEMKSFLQWYKDNRKQYNIRFKGCDDSYWVYYGLLEENTTRIKDKKLDKLMQKLKSNLSKYSNANLKKERKFSVAIYNDFVSIENYLKSVDKLSKTTEEILFNLKTSYINYVYLENKKPIQSRDEIMADRISYLAKDNSNKIIVWAHNAHISNKAIYKNEIGIMGRDLKQEFGDDYHSIGQTTFNGSYSYINQKFINGDHSYNDKLKIANIQSYKTYLWENTLALNGEAYYMDMSTLKKELKTDEILDPTKLIGYRKETTEDMYPVYFMKLFDSLIFIENTNATVSLFD